MDLTQSWVGTTLLIGAILFPGLGLMDYYVVPDKFSQFIVYRLIVSALLLILYYLNRLKQQIPYQYTIVVIGTALSAVTIELAVLQSGGQASTYYAGMGLVAICALGFIPISMPLAYSLVVIVYGVYVIPILLTERITEGVFVSNNGFMISTFIVALVWRYYNQKLIMTELSLREELSRDRDKLEQYSSHLEELVAEKTGKLGESEQRHRSLYENANDGIALLDKNGLIVSVNPRFSELHGIDLATAQGKPFRMLEAEGSGGGMQSRMRDIMNGDAVTYETEHSRKDGSTVALEISAKAIEIGGVPHIQVFLRDVTEKKKLQEHVLHSQKMDSMGVLAGGIAHDFNNVLTAILGHAEVLRRRVKNDEFAQRRVKTIEDAARRAGQMVTKLLSFARRESLELSPTDLNAVVRDTVELLERTFIDRKIKAQVRLAEDLPLIMGDGIHLEQVLTNLVMNSMDAMPGGGSISISTRAVSLGADAALAHPLLTPGRYVVLAASDTGIGIPPEYLDRIFDPFFTTKPAGKGTGLGLAMVYGIVKSHKGEIAMESRPGMGTSFSIYVPAAEGVSLVQTKAALEAPRSALSGTECILVVDDEEDVLTYIKDILDLQGYKVLLADNPLYAIDLFRQIHGEIDLVVTDLLMPHENGVEMSRQFKEIKSDVLIVGISGFDGGNLMREAEGIDGFLKKPFDGQALLSILREVLDANKRPMTKAPADRAN